MELRQVIKTSKQVTKNSGFKYVVVSKNEATCLEEIKVTDIVNDTSGYSLEFILPVTNALGVKYDIIFSGEHARFMHGVMTLVPVIHVFSLLTS